MLSKKQEAINKIKEIFLETNAEWIRCMDLEKLVTEHGIPIPTFYRRLREMTQEGILIKDKGKGKKSSYRLNPKAVSKEEKELETLKLDIDLFINRKVREAAAEKLDKKEVLQIHSLWSGALNLWAVLEQIDTGKPFIRIAKFYNEGLLLKQQPYRQAILSATPFLPFPELIRLSDPNTCLGDKKEYKAKTDQWKKALRELFPEQIEALEGLSKNHGF
jgi:hypothetical protein